MPALRTFTFSMLLLLPAGAFAQGPSPIVTDRPGFLFSSLTVGRGVLQTEWGIPAVTLGDTRLTSLFGLVRYGVTRNLELRLDSPVYNHSRTGSGYGDLEIGAKWHLFDNQGARPSLALIPSVILPTGQKGFTADDPVYQLNVMAEWTLPDSWGLAGLAGFLSGRYEQETFGISLGRSLPSPKWSAYGEAVYVATNLDGASDSPFLGGGIKYLISNDVQLDLSFDRGLTAESPGWLLGLGIAARF